MITWRAAVFANKTVTIGYFDLRSSIAYTRYPNEKPDYGDHARIKWGRIGDVKEPYHERNKRDAYPWTHVEHWQSRGHTITSSSPHWVQLLLSRERKKRVGWERAFPHFNTGNISCYVKIFIYAHDVLLHHTSALISWNNNIRSTPTRRKASVQAAFYWGYSVNGTLFTRRRCRCTRKCPFLASRASCRCVSVA